MNNQISLDPQHAAPTSGRQSGEGMDRVVTKKITYRTYALYLLPVVVTATVAWWLVNLINGGRTLSVETGHISIAPVILGTYEDFIPLRGRLVPGSTVYLDAIEGGRVEKVFIEDGALLHEGDPIVQLSNTSLQLDVLSREASVAEQLNTMRTIELGLEQNRLEHKRNLIDIDYRILTLTRQIERQSELVERHLASHSGLDDLEDELAYYQKRREITLESQATDTLMQEQQLIQLRETGKRLESNLSIAQKTLDDLSVTAPVDGKLSGFDIEVGQSVGR